MDAGIPLEASDDRSCLERGQDAVTQVVECVQQRLAHYRAAGELAVTFGVPVLRRKLDERVAAALRRPTPPEPTPAVPSSPGVPAERERTASRSEPSEPLNGSARPAPVVQAAPDPTLSATLAIPGYDSLSASQVVERLTGLPPSDLDEVREYEAAHRNRRTILGKIDQLRSSA